MGQKVSLYQGSRCARTSSSTPASTASTARRSSGAGARCASASGSATPRTSGPRTCRPGVRQRAGLALATLHEPRLLFLDEPTAGVDVASRGLFWELIQDEADAGVTVFVTTHFLEEVDYCDRVCLHRRRPAGRERDARGAARALLGRLPDRRVAGAGSAARARSRELAERGLRGRARDGRRRWRCAARARRRGARRARARRSVPRPSASLRIEQAVDERRLPRGPRAQRRRAERA